MMDDGDQYSSNNAAENSSKPAPSAAPRSLQSILAARGMNIAKNATPFEINAGAPPLMPPTPDPLPAREEDAEEGEGEEELAGATSEHNGQDYNDDSHEVDDENEVHATEASDEEGVERGDEEEIVNNGGVLFTNFGDSVRTDAGARMDDTSSGAGAGAGAIERPVYGDAASIASGLLPPSALVNSAAAASASASASASDIAALSKTISLTSSTTVIPLEADEAELLSTTTSTLINDDHFRPDRMFHDKASDIRESAAAPLKKQIAELEEDCVKYMEEVDRVTALKDAAETRVSGLEERLEELLQQARDAAAEKRDLADQCLRAEQAKDMMVAKASQIDSLRSEVAEMTTKHSAALMELNALKSSAGTTGSSSTFAAGVPAPNSLSNYTNKYASANADQSGGGDGHAPRSSAGAQARNASNDGGSSAALSALKNKYDLLEYEVQSLKQANQQLQTQLDSANSNNRLLQKQLSDEINSSSNSSSASSAALNEQQQQTIDHLMSTNSALKENVRSLETAAMKDGMKLAEKTRELEHERSRWAEQMRQYERQLQDGASRLAHANEEINTSLAQNVHLENENRNLMRQVGECTALEQQYRQAQGTIQSLEHDLSSLRQDNAHLKQRVDMLHSSGGGGSGGVGVPAGGYHAVGGDSASAGQRYVPPIPSRAAPAPPPVVGKSYYGKEERGGAGSGAGRFGEQLSFQSPPVADSAGGANRNGAPRSLASMLGGGGGGGSGTGSGHAGMGQDRPVNLGQSSGSVGMSTSDSYHNSGHSGAGRYGGGSPQAASVPVSTFQAPVAQAPPSQYNQYNQHQQQSTSRSGANPTKNSNSTPFGTEKIADEMRNFDAMERQLTACMTEKNNLADEVDKLHQRGMKTLAERSRFKWAEARIGELGKEISNTRKLLLAKPA